MTMMLAFGSKPSISTSSWFSVLFALVVAAAHAGTALAAHCVDLIDEDDRLGVLLGLLEQITNPGGADADEHLHKV